MSTQDAGCFGELGPVAEACNGIDDDCNGIVDDKCGCAYVSPAGSDSNPGTANLPVRRIMVGIEVAADAGVDRVCVAAGPSCPATARFGEHSDAEERLVMRDGISVYGRHESTTWTRDAGCLTWYTGMSDAGGVLFGATVTRPTTLDGFRVFGPTHDPYQVAVSIVGSTGAVLSNDEISGWMTPQISIGIEISEGGTPTITRSMVRAGVARDAGIAIWSRDSSPIIIDNCSEVDDGGRCTGTGPGQGIVGSFSFNPARELTAILLERSPRSVIERNAIRGSSGIVAAKANYGVLIRGDATDIAIRRNSIVGVSGSQAEGVGVDLEDCAGASPLVVDNFLVSGGETFHARGVGVRSATNCRPIVTHNVDIRGCYAVLPPATCIGVEATAGHIALIDNAAITGATGNAYLSVGVHLVGASGVIARNGISGGCTGVSSIGVVSDRSNVRFENNAIRACGSREVVGLRLRASDADVHSNTIVADSHLGSDCYGAAIELDAADGGEDAGPSNTIRNNVLRAWGTCFPHYSVLERDARVTPRAFEHNLLNAWWVLYRDDGITDVTDAGALTSGNIAGDPGFVDAGDFHLTPTSICRNAGTDAGAPLVDFDGHPRPAEGAFDIGADEYVP